MKTLNILHMSDAHVQQRNKEAIKEIAQKLIEDVKLVQNQKNMSIDLVCFTGDLIQSGDKALSDEKQWELAMEILINPLIENLGLTLDKFIFVPGNHEVDITQIVPRLEKGLQIDSLQDINEILNQFDDSYKKRLRYCYDIIEKQHTDAILGKLGYVYKKQINSLNVGIVCVDSAWRSSGNGLAEKGHLYVGPNQIKELFCRIEDCDVKICMMHHPIDWLEDCECIEVEKLLSKFDIVLRGHVHEEDLKQVLRNKLKTVYCTAGKLYPLDYAEGHVVEGYNGYSILSIDCEKCSCNVYIRSYYGKNRQEFDAGINICQNGEVSYDVFVKDDSWKLEFDVIKGIDKYFHNMSEKYALIKEVDTQSPNDFLQVMVDPVLSEQSEYVKENADDENTQVCIDEIVESNENIFLIGKKESGKTTILQQIGLNYIDGYENRGIIPIYINMKHLPKGKDKILNRAIQFIQENVIDHVAISKQQIRQLFDEGRIVFLIDNVKTNSADHTIWITNFISQYNSNRFILTIEEEFFQSLDVKELPDYGNSFREVYIQYMGKAQIRAMVTQWAKGREQIVDIEETVNKIDSYCNQINFAKTPFNIAVFMVLWDNDNNFIPVNEGIVMENYLEIVLEKLSPKERYRSTYSFKIKQDFLSHVAYMMYSKDEYFFTYEEYRDIIQKYHTKKGYNIAESKFEEIFFEKNILAYSGEYIVFSHTSFLEYFLALYAFDNREFLKEITSPGTRIYFKNEICFYAGLNQKCTELLDNLSDAILDTVIEYMDLIEELNEMEIVTEFKMDRGEFIEDIQKNRPTQEELDAASDRIQKYNDRKPTEISKRDVEENDAEDFFSLLLMYGSVIKNAELLDNNYKIEHLENYMYGMNMLYAMLIKLFEYGKDKMKFEKLSDEEKVELEVYTEEEFESKKADMVEATKLLFPVAIQNIILENVGTPKLGVAITELIKSKQHKPFEKFMLAFLKCDLKIVNLKTELTRYIKEEQSEGILKIMLMKLTFYYKMRFFGNNRGIDRDLINLITDIQVKLEPKLKSNYIPKSLISREIKKQIDE